MADAPPSGWLTRDEQRALAWLGTALVLVLGSLVWLGRPPALTVVSATQPRPMPGWDDSIERASRVRINWAAEDELVRLPRVGPALARRIIATRQARGLFREPAELLQVPGIGPATYQALEDFVTVD
jgi:hypothetical protein